LAEFWRFREVGIEMVENDQPERKRNSPTGS